MDPELLEIIDYITNDTLPGDPKYAQKLALTISQYTVIEEVLYFIEKDRTLQIIPPTFSHCKLFEDAHNGTYGGHLRGAKIHGWLGR